MIYHSEKLINELNVMAEKLRLDALTMIHRRGQGHPGGSLSIAEIIAALFFHHLRIDPQNPSWDMRDRFILSKGHACATLYSALARRGFFPVEELKTWGELASRLQGHPDRLKTPGVEMSSGFLGHGVAIGVGLCLAARIKEQSFHTYVLSGDGECQAGILWEGAMAAGKYKLSNLTAIVDYNDVQLDGPVHEIMPLEPFVEKWASFNFEVLQINGHNMREVLDALDMSLEIHDRPTVIIAHTTKGKGVSFMENKACWHGRAPDDEEFRRAKLELSGEAG
ncbi:transketolase [Candidatus Aerophobetes bacterium]|nr:transketolase [Candidatus Aerophobetes bacterium]